MNKNTTNLIITAILFFGIGYLVSAFLGVQQTMEEPMSMDSMDHGHTTGDLPHDHSGMTHELLDVSDWETRPSVSIAVTEDAKSGWNLQITTENFTFNPENASQDHVEGEGHAHLYVDGAKITRLYGEWYHLPELSPGEREIRVTLNANNHDDLALGEEVISDTVTVTVE